MFKFTKEDKKCLMKIGFGFIVIMILFKLFKNTTSSKLVEGLVNKGIDVELIKTVAKAQCSQQAQDGELEDGCLAIAGTLLENSDNPAGAAPMEQRAPEAEWAVEQNGDTAPPKGFIWNKDNHYFNKKEEELLFRKIVIPGGYFGRREESMPLSSGNCSQANMDVCNEEGCNEAIGWVPTANANGEIHGGLHCPLMNSNDHPFAQIESALKFCNKRSECQGISAFLKGGEHGFPPQICFRSQMVANGPEPKGWGKGNLIGGQVCMRKIPVLQAGLRVYAKYTAHRTKKNKGLWYGATVVAVVHKGKDVLVDLLYDDGDTAGPSNGGKTPPAVLKEIRWWTSPIVNRFKNVDLPQGEEKNKFSLHNVAQARASKIDGDEALPPVRMMPGSSDT